MFRTWVILRHTFVEAVVQPIYPLLLVLGALILGVYAVLPFFTLGEDVMMYKAVGLDVITLLVLVGSLFGATRSIYEEIEDRTMLTLMSKPVARWQVLLGKFLGLLAAAGLAVALLGGLLMLCVWLRVPGDFALPSDPIDEVIAGRLFDLRRMHLLGLLPQLVLLWMQIGVLVAVAVAISTRFGLVVNLPATLLIYLAGNLTRFVDVAAGGHGFVVRALAYALDTVLPFLSVFDLTDYTVYGTIKLAGTSFADDGRAVTLGSIWLYVALAAIYFLCYVTFVLGVGYASLQSRELGGSTT